MPLCAEHTSSKATMTTSSTAEEMYRETGSQVKREEMARYILTNIASKVGETYHMWLPNNVVYEPLGE